MGQAHRGVRGVDALAAVAGGAVHVDADIVRIEIDFDVIDFRQDCNGCRRSVDTAGRLGLGDALHTVDAALVLESGVSALALDQDFRFLDAADAGVVHVHDLDLPAFALGVHGVHAQKVRPEESRLITACTRADLEDDVAVIVGVLREQEDLELLFKLLGLLFAFGKLHLGEFLHLLVEAGLTQDILGILHALQNFLVLLILLDDGLHLAHLLGILLPVRLIRDDRRVRAHQGEFFIFVFNEVQFF